MAIAVHRERLQEGVRIGEFYVACTKRDLPALGPLSDDDELDSLDALMVCNRPK